MGGGANEEGIAVKEHNSFHRKFDSYFFHLF